jgi:hypothetical protein
MRYVIAFLLAITDGAPLFVAADWTDTDVTTITSRDTNVIAGYWQGLRRRQMLSKQNKDRSG